MDIQATPTEIYLGHAGARTGPYTMDQVRTLVSQGRFTPDDWAWYPGAPQWIAIRDLPGFGLQGFPPPPEYRAPIARAAEAGLARYAGFWIRVLAAIIDGIALWIPIALVERILLAPETGDATADLPRTLGALGLSAVVHWLYRGLLHSSEWQATLGKRAVGIIVADEHGGRITFGHATGRYLAKFLSALTLGIGYAMAGLTQRKQALHDKIAGTVVMYR